MEANSKSSLYNGVFRLEDNFIQVTKDISRIYKDIDGIKGEIGEIKGQIGTMKWQLGVLLAIGLGGSGLILLYLLKKNFDEPKNRSPGKTEMQEILSILESMKPTDSAKKSVPKA